MHIKVNRQNFLTAVRIVEKSIKDNKININYNVDFTKINYDKAREKLGFKKPSLDEERKLSNVEQQLENNGLKEKK